MRVKVLFFGMLKDVTGFAAEQIELEEPASLATVWDLYAARFPRIHELKSHLRLALNHEFSTLDAVVKPGAEIAFLPPVSGGSDKTTHYALTRDSIDTRALIQLIQRGHDGAIVTFEGVVRDNTDGRPTEFLEYEGYEEMAIAMIRRLGCGLLAKHAIGGIAIVHRLGKLAIGEASVVIVVSAPHRKPAFEACHEAIDRLKTTVPIWKKEHFGGGEVWVEGNWENAAIS
jgi:molybdopterin synthase catalytic subunit